jgi:hypothetical protein
MGISPISGWPHLLSYAKARSKDVSTHFFPFLLFVVSQHWFADVAMIDALPLSRVSSRRCSTSTSPKSSSANTSSPPTTGTPRGTRMPYLA